MEQATKPQQTPSFLQEGGEMGERTRNYDWSQTPLGKPDNWPQSLRIIVSLLLNSRFPMFLFWGPEFICFYNDAYRPSLGANGKHPGILGKPGQEAWPEIWDFIGPMNNNILNGAEATWYEDQSVPIYRNGRIEPAFWTFSYSPVLDDEGNRGGVLVTCTETTAQVTQRRQLEESEARFRMLIEQAPMAVGMLEGRDMVISLGNNKIFELWGKPSTVTGLRLIEALPELDGQPFMALLENVYDTGVPHFGNGTLAKLERKGVLEDIYFDFTYAPVRNAQGRVTGIMALAAEVTQRELAAQALAESEARFRTLVVEAPVAMFIFRGENMVINTANKLALAMISRTDEVVGKPLLEAVPELTSSPAYRVFQEVYHTGQAHYGQEVLVPLERAGVLEDRYFNFAYTPLLENGQVVGVMDVATEVTDQVLARRQIEDVVAQRTKALGQANQSLQASNAELQRSNLHLEEFAHAASHDLKEPVRKIAFFISRLETQLKEQLTQEQTQTFSRVSNATERMGTLIDDLLLYSHVSQRPPEKEPVDLNKKWSWQ